jgi:hypothetical protein
MKNGNRKSALIAGWQAMPLFSGLSLAYGIHPNAPTDNNQRHIYPCDESSL